MNHFILYFLIFLHFFLPVHWLKKSVYGQFPFLLRNGMLKSQYDFEFRNIFEMNYHLNQKIDSTNTGNNYHQWIEFLYRPGFIFGNIPIGFGFQFPFSIDKDLNIRGIHYQKHPVSILSKLDFFQYGYEDEKAFLLIAPLHTISFEDNFIISDYQNNLLEHEYRNIGLLLRIDIPGIKSELIVSNFITQSLIAKHLQVKIGELFEDRLEPAIMNYLKRIKLGFINANDPHPHQQLAIKVHNLWNHEIIDYHEQDIPQKTSNLIDLYIKGPIFLWEALFESYLSLHYGKMLNLKNQEALNFNIQFYVRPIIDKFEFDYSIQFYYLFESGFTPQYFDRFYEITRSHKRANMTKKKKDWGVSVFLKHHFLKKKILLELNYTHLFPISLKENSLNLKFKVFHALPNLHIHIIYSIINFQNFIDFDFNKLNNYFHFEIIYGFNRLFHLGIRSIKGLGFYQELKNINAKNSLSFSIFTKISF